FSGLLALQRTFSVEAVDGNRDGLRLSGLDPAGIFLGKAGAVALELLALVVTCLVATIGVAAAGSLYGVLAAGLRVRETLLPLLLLPILAPVLLGATRSFEAALAGIPSDGWPW